MFSQTSKIIIKSKVTRWSKYLLSVKIVYLNELCNTYRILVAQYNLRQNIHFVDNPCHLLNVDGMLIRFRIRVQLISHRQNGLKVVKSQSTFNKWRGFNLSFLNEVILMAEQTFVKCDVLRVYGICCPCDTSLCLTTWLLVRSTILTRIIAHACFLSKH